MPAVEHSRKNDPPPSAGIRPRTAHDSRCAVASSRPALPGPRYSPETLDPDGYVVEVAWEPKP